MHSSDNFHLFLSVFSLQIPLCIFLEGLLNRRKYFNLPLKWRSNGLLSKGFSLSIVYKLSFCLSLLTFVAFAFNPCVALQDNVQKKGNRNNNHITITITHVKILFCKPKQLHEGKTLSKARAIS